eukprot:CFRG0857T1
MSMDDWLESWDGPDIPDIPDGAEDEHTMYDEEAYNSAQEVKGFPGLFIGGITAAGDLEFLQKNNITHVFIAGAMLKKYFPEKFKYEHIKCLDTAQQNLISYFNRGNEFINEGRKMGGVLVHCQYGVSRSAAFVLANIMKEKALSYDDAYDLVHSVRPYIEPNSGFVEQLQLYESMGFKIDENNSEYIALTKNTMM